jgi:dTDP-4-dehydrorhamnose 3,5-epimerase
MTVTRFDIDGPILMECVTHSDSRDAFRETWRSDTWAKEYIHDVWHQDNQSISTHSGTVRGLHWQRPPQAQAKMVRAVSGKIFDVAVDLRLGSAHFGRAIWVELDSEFNQQFYVPIGFADGFCTLTDNTLWIQDGDMCVDKRLVYAYI